MAFLGRLKEQDDTFLQGVLGATESYAKMKQQENEREQRLAALEYEKQKNADAIAREEKKDASEQANKEREYNLNVDKSIAENTGVLQGALRPYREQAVPSFSSQLAMPGESQPIISDVANTATSGVQSIASPEYSQKWLDKKAKEEADKQARALDTEYKTLQIQAMKSRPPEQTPEQKMSDELNKSAKMLAQKQAVFANKAAQAEKDVQDAEKAYDPTSRTEQIGLIPDRLKSPARKKWEAAANAWIQGTLRPESGAAIPPSELDAYRVTYFGQPGDDAETKENKRRLREISTKTLQSGGTYKPELSQQQGEITRGGKTFILNPQTGKYRLK